EKGRGGMALMVLGKQQPFQIDARPELLEFVAQQDFLEQFFLEPQRHRHAERTEAARRKGEIGLEQPIEFQERFVVEGDVIDLGDADAAGVKAIARGVMGKTRVVLLAGEALLLGGRHDAAVREQAGGAVVIKRRYAENAHARTTYK